MIQDNLNRISQQLNDQLKNFDGSSEKIIAMINRSVAEIESSLQKIYSEVR